MNTPDTGTAALDLDTFDARARNYKPGRSAHSLAHDVHSLTAEVRRLREAVARVEREMVWQRDLADEALRAGHTYGDSRATVMFDILDDITRALRGEQSRATADAVPCEHPPLHRRYSLGKVGVTCSDCGHVWLEQREASKPAADAGEMTP